VWGELAKDSGEIVKTNDVWIQKMKEIEEAELKRDMVIVKSNEAANIDKKCLDVQKKLFEDVKKNVMVKKEKDNKITMKMTASISKVRQLVNEEVNNYGEESYVEEFDVEKTIVKKEKENEDIWQAVLQSRAEWLDLDIGEIWKKMIEAKSYNTLDQRFHKTKCIIFIEKVKKNPAVYYVDKKEAPKAEIISIPAENSQTSTAPAQEEQNKTETAIKDPVDAPFDAAQNIDSVYI